jgi:chromosome partitioning protein
LTVGALVAAAGVLIPTQPQAADLRGLSLFLETLETIKSELNPELQTVGILVTFYDGRLNHHKAALDAMQRASLPLLPVTVGRSVRVAEAAGAGQSVMTYDPGNPQAAAYKQLAEVVTEWLRNSQT